MTTRLRARLGAEGSAAPAPEPLTVTVARTVRPDRREAFEAWADDALARAAHFPGNLGATLLRPGAGSSEYHLVYPPQPGPRWRMTVLTIAAVFAVTSGMQAVVLPYLVGWPPALRLLVSATVVVVLLGHVLMPALTRLFRGWLHPRR